MIFTDDNAQGCAETKTLRRFLEALGTVHRMVIEAYKLHQQIHTEGNAGSAHSSQVSARMMRRSSFRMAAAEPPRSTVANAIE